MVKLFVGTNDGGLRMLNAINGGEEWIFYPQMVMPRAIALIADGSEPMRPAASCKVEESI